MSTGGGLRPPSLNRYPTEQDNRSDENVGNVSFSNAGSSLEAQVTHEGRVDIHFNEKALKPEKRRHGKLPRIPWAAALQRDEESRQHARIQETHFQEVLGKYSEAPHMNIAIQIVGSRGDVQPFIAIGQILSRPPYNHRVRLCTHPVFKDFVEENGLEFFSIGGDPSSLMAYMVKNPGLLPGRESWKSGEVGKRRIEFAEILEKCWRSCIEAGNGMESERKGPRDDIDSLAEQADRCFIADAIIANPPSYGHIHCAEKLGIPLHMMFTCVLTPFHSRCICLIMNLECRGRQRSTFRIHLRPSKGPSRIQSTRTICLIP
jgi:sterol 3beta-glucosyltransferase